MLLKVAEELVWYIGRGSGHRNGQVKDELLYIGERRTVAVVRKVVELLLRNPLGSAHGRIYVDSARASD